MKIQTYCFLSDSAGWWFNNLRSLKQRCLLTTVSRHSLEMKPWCECFFCSSCPEEAAPSEPHKRTRFLPPHWFCIVTSGWVEVYGEQAAPSSCGAQWGIILPVNRCCPPSPTPPCPPHRGGGESSRAGPPRGSAPCRQFRYFSAVRSASKRRGGHEVRRVKHQIHLQINKRSKVCRCWMEPLKQTHFLMSSDWKWWEQKRSTIGWVGLDSNLHDLGEGGVLKLKNFTNIKILHFTTSELLKKWEENQWWCYYLLCYLKFPSLLDRQSKYRTLTRVLQWTMTFLTFYSKPKFQFSNKCLPPCVER